MTTKGPQPCAGCSKPFERKPGARTRLYCYECRPARAQDKKPPSDTPSATGGRLEAICQRELDEYGRADTTSGVVALGIARMLDGREFTGTQYVSLAKELRSAIAAAIAGAQPVGDTLDDLQTRRAERIARAAG